MGLSLLSIPQLRKRWVDSRRLIMKIESVTGCTCDSLTVDDVETVDMDKAAVKDVIKKLIDREDDLGTLQSILIDLVETQGEFEDLGHCEQCGDWITKYTVEL